MLRNFLILLLLLYSINTRATEIRYKDVKSFSSFIEWMYLSNDYEAVAKNVTAYFTYVNFDSKTSYKIKIYKEDGTISTNLKYYLNKKEYQFVLSKLKYPTSLDEAKIYYYGAHAFFNLAEKAWSSGSQKIIHFKNDNVYNINSTRLSYDYMAYIFSELSLYKLNDVIARERKHGFRNYDIKDVFLFYEMACECQYIKYIFDYKYYEAPGYLVSNDFERSIYFYTILANSPKKSYNYLRSLKKESSRFVKDYSSSLFDTETDRVLYDMKNDGLNGKKIISKYIPYVKSQLKNITISNNNVNHAIELQKLYRIINSSNNYMYMRSSNKERKAIIGHNFDAMISYNINDLYLRGAKQYENFRDIGWREIKSCLQPGDYCIHFFETTDGNDNWLLGYTISYDMESPYYEYFGHSYRSENDAFGYFNIEKLSYAKRIFYVGLDAMELQDAENGRTNIYRLNSLAELCMPNTTKYVNENMIVANLNYSCDTTFYAQNKGMSELLGDFISDKDIISILDSDLNSRWHIMSGDTVTNDLLKKISGKTYNILHISTHGMYDKNLESGLNILNPGGAITGENTLRSISLALSDYNSDNSNSISAAEFSAMDLSKIGLIFLSTCESGSGNINGKRVSSLTKALHVAGARNIIAFIGSVSEEFANIFTKKFYEKILEGYSYHDAFYQTKLEYTGLEKEGAKIVMWE